MATLTYATLSDVPEPFRDAAVEEGGKYTVKVDLASKTVEFRDNNVKLSQERDALARDVTKYEQVTGVSLADLSTGKLEVFAKALTELRDTKKKVDDGVLVATTSLDEAAAARVTDVTNSMKLQLSEMARERDAHRDRAKSADDRANSMMVENAIRLAASDPAVAMLDKAVSFLLPQAYRVFKVDDNGKMAPKTGDGTIIYGSDGVTPMSVKEWLLKQREESDFLFKGSKGGGSSGGDTKSAGNITAAELAGMTREQRLNYARAHKST